MFSRAIHRFTVQQFSFSTQAADIDSVMGIISRVIAFDKARRVNIHINACECEYESEKEININKGECTHEQAAKHAGD